MTEPLDDDALMALALEEAALAAEHGDVPIGCVVVVGGDPTAHAEVLALRDAAAAVGDGWRLADATVVVSVEPCPMCAGAVVAARAARCVFGAPNPEAGSFGSLYHLGADPRLNHEVAVTPGIRADESAALLASFFAAHRPPR